jgi:4'-phosphopantetheinyl transferase
MSARNVSEPPAHSPHGTAASPRSKALELWLASPEAASKFQDTRLSALDRARWENLRNPQKRAEFAVSRSLQQHLMLSDSGAFSLTHSGGYAAVAYCQDGGRVAVDLEKHRPRNFESIAEFAFAPQELDALRALPPAQRPARFYMLWVMKEALAKALQIPLLEALRHCVFARGPHGWTGTVNTRCSWRLAVFAPRPNFSLALATVDMNGEMRVRAHEWPIQRAAQWRTLADFGG